MEILFRGRSLVWLQILLVICIACVSTITCQTGFLSIDCGADESYCDNSTGILWETDASYISTGTNRNNITTVEISSNTANKGQLGTARYFDDLRSRDCYVLPVECGESYLVRATFFYGDLGNGSSVSSFNVSLDNNIIGGPFDFTTEDLNQVYNFEVVYSAPRSTLNVCLIRQQGSSFISALELRALAKGMYPTIVGPTLNNNYLELFSRINCGPSETGAVQSWRYPNDAYDRVWSLYGSSDNFTHISNRNIRHSSNSFAQDPDRPPLVVMESAWVHYDQDILWIDITNSIPLGEVYTAAYFQELDGNASATNVRGMNYLLNEVFIESFNSSDTPLEVHTNATLEGSKINMSFVKTNWSNLVPILNAFEIYLVSTYNIFATADEDVSALYALQVRLGLNDWTGDPCLPSPFDWLRCSDDVLPRITNLSLASHGYQGNIPLEISNLTALTYLAFNNNSFNGSIPDFSGLVHLKAIYFQNNDLSGEIPSFLGSAFPNLTQLNLDNNNLSGMVPSDLNKSGLNVTVSNNPELTSPSSLSPLAPSPNSSSSGTIIGAVVGGVLGGVLVGLIVVIGIRWIVSKRKRRARSTIIKGKGKAESRNQGRSPISSLKGLQGSMALLTLHEVSDATNKFLKKIGEGSFGPVYYGKLATGQEVAVKVKSRKSRQGASEFFYEIELLSRIHHRNLVSLVGYCEEGNQQILIYVYVRNGTLRDHLYGDKSRKPLDWRTRLDIALNSARGLEYLHTDCNPRIIHRDVKSSNILLDENMVAKVADFGISKQAPDPLLNSPGYLDPEYFISQRLTQESDVYSFGVVLLEVISGRHPHVSDLPDGTSGTLIQWARSAESNGSLLDIVDPSLNGEFNKESMMKAISLAIRSIDPVPAERPDMGQVVRTITEAIELEVLSEVLVKSGADATIDDGKNGKQEDSIVRVDSSDDLPGSDFPSVGPSAVVGGVLGGVLVGLIVVIGIRWILSTRKRRARSSIIKAKGNAERRNQGRSPISSLKPLQGSMTLLTLHEVSDATNKFLKQIGEGSFGPVYYGRLAKGQEVAVKVKSRKSRQGASEFFYEVELLSRIHHRNLVSLVGYCEEGNQQILIYVYVRNGTLRDHLYGDKSRKPLDWRTRLDIALNSARGLEYLHTDCNPRIIHRDVKSSNILLDENMVAKVADFGIWKQGPDTLVKDSPGYLDPEYFISQRLTQKSDVYSFGIVLLEVISGRHPHVSDLPDGTSGTLIQWARSAASNGSLLDIVDPSLNGEFSKESMMKAISLAIRSIDPVPAERPDMGQVVRTITEAIELEVLSEVLVKSGADATIDDGKDGKQEDSIVRVDSSDDLPGPDFPSVGPSESRNRGRSPISSVKPLQGSMTLLTLHEVSDATNKFSKKIGEGSFGPVYYGKLAKGQEVAVKVKSRKSRQGASEFFYEVELLSRIHHRNLVSLVGYCEEGNQQILIYVYVRNGTLRDHLYGDKSRKPLDWRTRLDIALNSARGLEYLHTDCNPRIIHRDVKSSNILLDENMVAKVADFGISKQALDTLLNSRGYFDPEYFISQRLTQESDVYSFGVVLLEVISGRHPHVSDLPDGTSGTLIQWARSAASNGSLLDIVDPSLNGEFSKESMMKAISLAIRSTDPVPAERPDMGQVVRTITEAIELEL